MIQRHFNHFMRSMFVYKYFTPTNSNEIIPFLHRVRPKLSALREAAPLLDLDRDERKLEAFLQLHKHDLLVADLRIFLPFTINLDPYLRKVLKEDQQAMEDEGIVMPMKTQLPMQQQFNNRAINYQMLPNNTMMPYGAPNALPYQPHQQYIANQPFTGFMPNTMPTSASSTALDPHQRKKSIIDGINPFISEQNNLPADVLKTFPVSRYRNKTLSHKIIRMFLLSL